MNGRKTLLVVDDEALILASITALFEDDFDVIATTDPLGALELTKTHDIAVVISDERMSSLSGHEFLARLRPMCDAKRILITGYADISALMLAINESQIYCYLNKPCEPLALQATVQRAAEHYEAECQVRLERDLLRSLMEGTPDPIYFKDEASRFTRLNQGAATILGAVSPKDCIGKTSFDFLPVEFALQAQADEDTILQTGHSLLEKVEQLNQPDGSPSYFSSSKLPLLTPKGKVYGTAGILRDITSLIRTQVALRASDEKFSQLADAIDEVFWIMSADSAELLYLSPGYERVWGSSWTSTPSDPHCWAKAVHADDRAAVQSAAVRLRKEKKVDVEYRIITASNAERWIWTRAFPVRDASGEIHRLAGISQDITERKLAGISLEAAKSEAEHANAVKTEFLAIVSHEIRTPMNAIIGMADLLWESKLDEEQREYVETFRGASNTLLRLINDILDVSKIEAGKIDLESAPFDLRDMANEIMDLLRAKAKQKRLDFLLDFDATLEDWWVGDATRLRQVLLNLLGNAFKFTEKGSIKLSIARATPSDAQSPRQILFSVTDTGIGILPEKQQFIFEDFRQADSSTTRKYGGTGLGLSISRGIVKNMGGQITVASQPGVGSTFSFSLALPIASAQQIAEQWTQEDFHGRRVLLVDHDPKQRGVLCDALAGWGFACDQSTDEQPALPMLDRTEPDYYSLLVLASGSSGAESLATAVQIRRTRPNLAIAILASDLQPEEANSCRKAGIVCAIKTLVRSELFRHIVKAMKAVHSPSPLLSAAPRPVDEPEVPLNILVAEDNRDNRLLIKAYLKDSPHTVEFAANGSLAVEQWKSKPFDLVLMDIQMPVMDGLTATQQIRAYERARRAKPTPIVALSANARPEDTELSRQVGCTAHVSKPVSKRTLLDAVRRYGHQLEKSPAEPESTPELATADVDSSNAPIRITVPADFEELTPQYLESRRIEIGEMLNMVTSSDFETLRKLGHNLKGSGGSYGFVALSRMGADVERSAKATDRETLQMHLTSIASYLSRVELVFDDAQPVS